WASLPKLFTASRYLPIASTYGSATSLQALPTAPIDTSDWIFDPASIRSDPWSSIALPPPLRFPASYVWPPPAVTLSPSVLVLDALPGALSWSHTCDADGGQPVPSATRVRPLSYLLVQLHATPFRVVTSLRSQR